MKKSPLLKQANGQLRWRSNLSLQFSMPPTRLLKQVQQVRIASKTLGWKKTWRSNPLEFPPRELHKGGRGKVSVRSRNDAKSKEKVQFWEKVGHWIQKYFSLYGANERESDNFWNSLVLFFSFRALYISLISMSSKTNTSFTRKKWLVTPIYFHFTNVCDKLCLVSQVEVFLQPEINISK